ncbi:MAG: DUF4317 domain-containing protein [Oscillospiraceae bacterium]|nr:DUF4317 domain-containing protein [Oscillospiraceae bacterium]
MNQKELGEIRRRFRPDHNNIQRIFGCYVNTNKEIIASFEESLGLLSQNETEKYLTLLKKTLSGALGKNLLDISFATREVMEGEQYRLLSQLRKTELQDAALREEFCRAIIEKLDMEERNYLILMAYDVYDVPHYGKDGNRDDEGGELYKYFVCCVCPVKEGKPELGYEPEERRFHSAAIGQVVSAPELGFLFPAFDARSANIYNALFYTRDASQGHEDFVEAVFRAEAPIPAARQKELFGEMLSQSLEAECSFDVIQAVHEQLSERMTVHKESKDPEPLTLSEGDMGDILENSGVSPEHAEAFTRRMAEELGEGTPLRPANISSASKMEIETPEVKISVDPKYSYLIQPRIIDGHKYLLVSADAGVELNGLSVEIRDV